MLRSIRLRRLIPRARRYTVLRLMLAGYTDTLDIARDAGLTETQALATLCQLLEEHVIQRRNRQWELPA